MNDDDSDDDIGDETKAEARLRRGAEVRQEHRPESVRCVARDRDSLSRMSWCGRRIWRFDKPFDGLDQAARNGAEARRLVACRECVDAAMTALRTGESKCPSKP